MITQQAIINRYLKAIEILKRAGLRQVGFVSKSQASIKTILEAREGLAAFQIEGMTKALLTTDENWAIAASIVAKAETALDMELVSPGRDWILELEVRAYKLGDSFAMRLAGARGVSIAEGLKGIDATTLRLMQDRAYKNIIGLANDQIEYLRTMLTNGVIENRTWPSLQKQLIIDGKIPALVDSKGRLISMERRVEMIVHNETSQIAEQGTRDKAREIYGGEELACKWHTNMDGRERESHAERNEEIRLVTDWQNDPHPSDDKAVLPGEDFGCRCWGEYGTLEELQKVAA